MATIRIGRAALALVVGAVMVSVTAAAQGRAGAGMPRYDTSTEITVSGTVDQVQSHQGRMGGTGLHLAVRTGTGVLDVHVGPTRWLAEQGFEFAVGEALDIVGSSVSMDGKSAFLARQITKAGQTMVMRTDDGRPKWSRRGNRTN